MSIKQFDFSNVATKPFSIALVVSRFNPLITQRLLDSALARLKALNFSDALIQVIHVPGAVEIPLICKQLAKEQSIKAIITLGCVIRGETSHYDYVCQMVSDDCLSLSMEHNLPIIFGVLTTENAKQALARSGGEHSDKGSESVDAAIEMVELMRNLDTQFD